MKKRVNDYAVVFVTASSPTEARRIAHGILSRRLAACVNILNGVESHFHWQGKVEKARECLLIMKTTKRAVAPLMDTVKALHSYSVPEIIALPIEAGANDYLKWIGENVK